MRDFCAVHLTIHIIHDHITPSLIIRWLIYAFSPLLFVRYVLCCFAQQLQIHISPSLLIYLCVAVL